MQVVSHLLRDQEVVLHEIVGILSHALGFVVVEEIAYSQCGALACALGAVERSITWRRSACVSDDRLDFHRARSP